MADSKYIDLIAGYLSGNINTPERAELLEWAESGQENQKFFDEMVQLWSITETFEDDVFEADIPAAWNKLDKRIDDGTLKSASGGSARVIPFSPGAMLLRVAAAALLLIAASYGVYSVWSINFQSELQYVVVRTIADENKEVVLPDGTKIWLNENTELFYPEDFAERSLELEGEAFFDVAHQENLPFVITTGEVQTEVLGTAFNLRAYLEEKQVEVTVQRGKVALGKKITENDQAPPQPVILEKGNTGVFDLVEEKAVKFEAELTNVDAWKTGILDLDGLEMNQVITVLERYYDVDLDVSNENILNCSVTSLYYENQPLDTVLAGIAYMMTLEVRQPSDSLIVFTGEGCLE